ncbi:MAG TPA: trypsin-like peptidase domain-containing protein [Casimicrobiaceae bacterium]|nr:trypsin-like peptidase domain-containing protein [Casimicrobiaceae bacterium]
MRLPTLLLQLLLAAIVGYAAARYAVPVPETGTQRTPPAVPAPQSPAAPPPALPVSPPATPANTAGTALSVSFRSAVARAAPSVFTVHSARTVSRGPLGLGGTALLSEGLGSGVLIDGDGDVVTNNHVVEGANELEVALPDGSVRKTKLVGVDPYSDLALLKIDPSGLTPITIGDLSQVAVGDVVLAIGNPLAVGQTVTQGIISALGRKGLDINPIENFIQTDAAINPGNSGGALVDTSGRLIGINSAILSRGGGSEGIGFAIPIDLVQKVVESLKKHGRVARGYLGVSTMAPRNGEAGALVAALEPRGPADRAGVEVGDVIVGFGGHEIGNPEDVAAATLELEPGTKVKLEVLRNGRHRDIEVALGTRPPPRPPRGR